MKHKKGDNISGWLIIDKDINIGSTDVVNQTRRLLNSQKNGHTGTLDPFATGVLPIAFGEATKLIPFVTDGDKEYEFVLQFGSTTDTLDITGTITNQNGRIPTKQEIIETIPHFAGTPYAKFLLPVLYEATYSLKRKTKIIPYTTILT